MPAPTALTIGNFDGVHIGHQRLVRAAREAVGAEGSVCALSFDPHPISILRPDHTPPRLTRFDQRRDQLLRAGADTVERIEPTPELLGREPHDFIESLVKRYRPALFVEGPDFRFGKRRAGSVETLRDLGRQMNFRTIVLDAVEVPLANHILVRVSSSIIRWLLVRGRVDDARRLLGRPYELTGPVVSGDRRGRDLGVPTANLDHGELLLPADGIYAGRARGHDGDWHPAAISIGTKPTFGRSERLCEAHLIDYAGPVDHYGWTIRITLDAWLREQLAYADVPALLAQLRRDIERTRQLIPAAVST